MPRNKSHVQAHHGRGWPRGPGAVATHMQWPSTTGGLELEADG